MDYSRIPAELRALKQWVVWKYQDVGAAKPTKVPYNANIISQNSSLANVNDSSTWCSYDTAITAVQSGKYSGIGFVFTNGDPYTFIDLDDTLGDQVALNRQIKVYQEFNSYSEISPSEKGLHIIIKGSIPSGRRRAFIEVYSSQRYATMTGNVYNDKPIVDQQDKLTSLWEQMGGQQTVSTFKGDDNEKYTDEEIIKQARNAVNGDKFSDLYAGNWNTLYPSQSEADFAFINIIAFYTKNRNQIGRIFRNCVLGLRSKAKRQDYLDWMINKSFDRDLPLVDIDLSVIQLNDKITSSASVVQLVEPAVHSSQVAGSSPVASTKSPMPALPGLLGELAHFILKAAPRPVPEIAIAAAMGLMAGICGRAYNISGTGLNQYILILAPTGSGKEAAASGIDKLMNEVKKQVPTSISFIGPSEIASGQALIKHLSKTSNCFVSVLGEFGLRLESMSSPTANSAERALKRMLLDLYNKSGYGQVFRPSIFADSDKNINATNSPAFSILGESTPERFYSILNEDMISEGLLPRFMIIEYNGFRPALSPDHLNVEPGDILMRKFASLVGNVEVIMHNHRVINIQSTYEATALLEAFDNKADKQINLTTKEVLRQLWNRAHMKALKICGLIAVGVNMSDPVVLPEYVYMAIQMVENDILALSNKFEMGEIGKDSYEGKQQLEIIRMIKDYLMRDYEYVKKYTYGDKSQKMHLDKIIPYAYLNKRLSSCSAFTKDRVGTTNALKKAIQVMIDSDLIAEVNKEQLVKRYASGQRAFVITNSSILD